MNVGELSDRLLKIIEKYGRDFEVHILTESKVHGQVEQSLGDVAIPISYVNGSSVGEPQGSVKLLPEGF